jgi:cytochrome c biogenesis protein CcmG, thiol:disulfide interchange protein DsbE
MKVNSRQLAAYAFVLAAIIVAGFTLSRGDRHAGKLIPASARRTMPPVELSLLNGGTWTLVDHRGWIVVINYWATWCGPCRQEMPGLMRLQAEMQPLRVAILGVAMDQGNSDEVQRRVQQFVDSLHVNYPIALMASMSQMEFGMEGLPTTVLVDQNGRVARIYVGAMREQELLRDIQVLLGESSVAG